MTGFFFLSLVRQDLRAHQADILARALPHRVLSKARTKLVVASCLGVVAEPRKTTSFEGSQVTSLYAFTKPSSAANFFQLTVLAVLQRYGWLDRFLAGLSSVQGFRTSWSGEDTRACLALKLHCNVLLYSLLVGSMSLVGIPALALEMWLQEYCQIFLRNFCSWYGAPAAFLNPTTLQKWFPGLFVHVMLVSGDIFEPAVGVECREKIFSRPPTQPCVEAPHQFFVAKTSSCSRTMLLRQQNN